MEKEAKKDQQEELNISVTALSVNGPNASNKRHILSKWMKKTKLNHMLLMRKKYLKNKNIERLKVR